MNPLNFHHSKHHNLGILRRIYANHHKNTYYNSYLHKELLLNEVLILYLYAFRYKQHLFDPVSYMNANGLVC